MTHAKSLKHFVAKSEKLRKKNLPYRRKLTRKRYQKNQNLARLSKRLSKRLSGKPVIDLTRKKPERKTQRKRYNSMAYFKRKSKKPASLGKVITYHTPEKRKRLTDVYNFDQDLVYDMDPFEVNFNFYI